MGMTAEVVPYQPDMPVRAPSHDPASVGFPHMLPVELALGEQPVRDICEAYGVSKPQFTALVANPIFIKAFSEAREQLKKEGMSFRIKARMQAEALLGTSWKLIHHDATPAAVKADLIKSTFRVAGLEPKEGSATAIVPLQINITL